MATKINGSKKSWESELGENVPFHSGLSEGKNRMIYLRRTYKLYLPEYKSIPASC